MYYILGHGIKTENITDDRALMNILPSDKKELIAIIKKHLPNTRIYLFGSRARSASNPGSDIDIALDNNKPIDWSILGSIKEEIADSNILLFVDVVDIHDVSDEFKKQITRDGILWN